MKYDVPTPDEVLASTREWADWVMANTSSALIMDRAKAVDVLEILNELDRHRAEKAAREALTDAQVAWMIHEVTQSHTILCYIEATCGPECWRHMPEVDIAAMRMVLTAPVKRLLEGPEE